MVELHPNHLDELSDFCNRNFDFHCGQFEPEILQKRIFDDPDRQLEGGFFLRNGAKTVGVMIGVLPGNEGWLKLFAVDKDRRRRGFVSVMLSEIETRLHARGAEQLAVLNSSRYYLTSGLDLRYTERLCFLQSHAYTFDRCVHNMKVTHTAGCFDTTQTNSKLGTKGCEIRRLRLEDEGTFREWMTQSWSAINALERRSGTKKHRYVKLTLRESAFAVAGESEVFMRDLILRSVPKQLSSFIPC